MMKKIKKCCFLISERAKNAEKKEMPEHIRQAVDLIAAVLRRIKEKALDKSQKPCLYMKEAKGVTA